MFITLVCSGCCRQDDLTLQPSILGWMPYQAQQELVFKNETGDSITFLTSVRHYNQQAIDKVCGAYAVETRETILQLKTDTALQVQVVLSHEAVVSIKASNKVVPGNNLLVQFNSISKLFISDPWRDRYNKELNVNGKMYPEVLHVYGNQIGGTRSFADLLYARNEGLIGLKLFDGGWYFLE